MREIKFRGFDVSRNIWQYGYFIKTNIGANYISTEEGIDQLVIDSSVGQYTGLKDRKGIGIYEGDIVRQYHPFSKFDYNDEKDFIDGEWVCEWETPRFIFKPIRGVSEVIMTKLGGELTEVIGNRYEDVYVIS